MLLPTRTAREYPTTGSQGVPLEILIRSIRPLDPRFVSGIRFIDSAKKTGSQNFVPVHITREIQVRATLALAAVPAGCQQCNVDNLLLSESL